MKASGESNTFYIMLAVSLALNLFFLPVIAGRWFWTSRAERFIMEALHPAEVKTVTLHPPKKTLPPKLKPQPKPKAIPPAHLRPQPTTAAPLPPHPHVMAVESGGKPQSGTPVVTQGIGQAGTPTLPTAPSSPPPPPKGETRDAAPASSPLPQIPESLRSQVLKTFVRARFEIAPDGTARVTLLTGSGSPELDQITLDTLRQWRWKPALQNGVPVSETQRLRIEFEVQ